MVVPVPDQRKDRSGSAAAMSMAYGAARAWTATSGTATPTGNNCETPLTAFRGKGGGRPDKAAQPKPDGGGR